MPAIHPPAHVAVLLGGTLVTRLDMRDRALFLRCALLESSPLLVRWWWTAMTHLGGVVASIAAATLPLLAGGTLAAAGRQATAALVASHLVVQLVKRAVGRPRPSRGTSCAALAAEPDRFSFPSGHAAAAMSVAFVYAAWFPGIAAPLVALAGLVGMSRVFLGVHYPGDVLIGQLIAVVTAIMLR